MMKRYAMILENMVIDILPNQEVEPQWPPDIDGHPVIAVLCEDESVIPGMVYDHENGTFFHFVEEVITPDDISLQRYNAIHQTQLTIMTAMAEQYEESLERELTNMEVQATIYEAILELGGAE